MSPKAEGGYSLTILTGLFKRTAYSGTGIKKVAPRPLLVFILSGQGLLLLNGQMHRIQAGQVYSLGAQSATELYPQGGTVEVGLLLFRKLAAIRKRASCLNYEESSLGCLFAPGKVPVRDSNLMLKSFQRLEQAFEGYGRYSTEAQRMFQVLLQQVEDERAAAAPSGEETAAGGLERSLAYMHQHFRERITLETLSSIAGLTATSYSRSFKKSMGASPVEYLNAVRINHSKTLLDKSGATVSGTAQSSGFGNEFYFSRMFKRETGISPVMYMKRKQLRVGVACCMRYGDCLRSMGLTPVGMMNGLLHLREQDQEESLVLYQRSQLDALRRSKPDVILADIRHLPFREQLKQIAPTVVVDYSADWRKVYRKLALLVGREHEAAAVVRRMEERIAQARRMLDADCGDRSFSYLRLYGSRIRVQGIVEHPLNVLLYRELGLQPGSGVVLNRAYREYELEELAAAEKEELFIYDDPDRSAKEALLLSRLKSDLSAYGSGGRRLLTASNWVGKSWSPLGQLQIIDELLRQELQ